VAAAPDKENPMANRGNTAPTNVDEAQKAAAAEAAQQRKGNPFTDGGSFASDETDETRRARTRPAARKDYAGNDMDRMQQVAADKLALDAAQRKAVVSARTLTEATAARESIEVLRKAKA